MRNEHNEEQHDLARVQTTYLEGLGIYQRGFAPEGVYGRGRIQYHDEDLANRIAWYGFQGPQLLNFFSGEVALTLRTALRLAKASHGTYENRNPDITIRLVVTGEGML